jgi:predicted lipoprotein
LNRFAKYLRRLPNTVGGVIARGGWCCLLLATAGCDNNTSAPEASYGPLLSNLTDEVIVPEHQAFATEADALVTAVQALQSMPTTDTLVAAQGAWRSVRGGWRLLDAAHFGPIIKLATGDHIDVSPADTAAIEAAVMSSGNLDDAAVAKASSQARGFFGLEYLLFSADSSVPPPALASDGFASRRRTLAHSMADDIATSAHSLDTSWEPSGGDYADAFKNAGSGSAIYTTQRAAVDDAVGGVSYALEEVVHYQLGVPLGLADGGTPDPSLIPTARSDNALADMTASLNGIGALYDGDGISAAVKAVSAMVDSQLLSDLSSTQAAVNAIAPPFATSLVNDSSTVTAAYDAAKALKAMWNTNITSALGATLMPTDNDGD